MNQNNIFFNKDNLVLALPLTVLCSTYAFFKFVPLDVGLPILGGAFLLFKINNMRNEPKHKGDSSTQVTVDNQIINELVDEEDRKEEMKARKEEKKAKRQEAKLRQRAAAQKKAANKRNNGRLDDSDNEDGDEDVSMLITKKNGTKKK